MLSWWAMSATVAVFTIELAMYMGFSEIFLMGYDCTMTISGGGSKHAGENDVYKDYQKHTDKIRESLSRRNMTEGEYDKRLYNMIINDYKNIEKVACNKGIKIWNATRGGMLEVFERTAVEGIV